MKKLLALFLSLFVVFTVTACGASNTASEKPAPVKTDGKVLVAYFSWGGHTRKVAEEIAKDTGGELFEIVPAVPYTSDYQTLMEYAKREQQENARPAMETKVDLSKYDTVFVGFPIWWYDAPMIIHTFLESGDFAGKTVIPFATSGGSTIDQSVETIKKTIPKATVENGFLAGSEKDVAPWLKKMGFNVK